MADPVISTDKITIFIWHKQDILLASRAFFSESPLFISHSIPFFEIPACYDSSRFVPIIFLNSYPRFLTCMQFTSRSSIPYRKALPPTAITLKILLPCVQNCWLLYYYSLRLLFMLKPKPTGARNNA